MIWSDAYGDADCNRLIRTAHAHSSSLKGVVVLSDRTNRQLDARAIQSPIAVDFDRPEHKKNGLAVKISLFEIDALPAGAPCVYVDLDSAIIGDLGQLAVLTRHGPLWTLPTSRARFSAWSRLRWRLSGGRRYDAGNSSIFAYRNAFPGNPTVKFRARTPVLGQAASDIIRGNDDLFVGWSCQDTIRPLPSNLAVRFRIEFLELSLWLNQIKALLRRKKRQDLVVITFDGALTKPDVIAGLSDGELVTDHHGRRARWTDFQMGGLRARMRAGLRR
ncbi:hypothetical protein [Yoonia vestfoldensis]|uniref:hypothetical protein n=1 Tax=Yoonia vestfoldensis TaxID=245188 RepID=UPI0003628E16|nr:hypothetical protein [Yoonia vestfoldensis]